MWDILLLVLVCGVCTHHMRLALCVVLAIGQLLASPRCAQNHYARQECDDVALERLRLDSRFPFSSYHRAE